MTIQEFFKKRPELLESLKRCKSEDEFSEMAEKNGIKFGNDRLNDVYNFVHSANQDSQEISDNALNAVAGGNENLSVKSLNFGDKEINLIV
ncbi:MAG: hypothetical protein RUMPE_00713 [Eubacteriales bacterium SKADARSKE-1]|nr:hypothetical protein [Eubacteriales bacterium SKADARSKE-1]